MPTVQYVTHFGLEVVGTARILVHGEVCHKEKRRLRRLKKCKKNS